MRSSRFIADRIQHRAERRGIDVEASIASTGSRYLTLDAGNEERIVVRVADHAECYCRENYSVDPFTGSIDPVLAWIDAHGQSPIRWSKSQAAAADKKLQTAGYRTARPDPSGKLVQVIDTEGYVVAMLDQRGVFGRLATEVSAVTGIEIAE